MLIMVVYRNIRDNSCDATTQASLFFDSASMAMAHVINRVKEYGQSDVIVPGAVSLIH